MFPLPPSSPPFPLMSPPFLIFLPVFPSSSILKIFQSTPYLPSIIASLSSSSPPDSSFSLFTPHFLSAFRCLLLFMCSIIFLLDWFLFTAQELAYPYATNFISHLVLHYSLILLDKGSSYAHIKQVNQHSIHISEDAQLLYEILSRV